MTTPTDEELRQAYQAGAPGALAWPWPEGLRAVLAKFGAQPVDPWSLDQLCAMMKASSWGRRIELDDVLSNIRDWSSIHAPAPVAQPAGEPASMQTGSPLRAAFDVWWDGEHDWGGSTQAACMAAFKAGAAAARVPLTDEQIYAGQDAREKRLGVTAFVQPAAYWFHAGARFSERAHGITSAGQEGGAA